MKIILSHQEAIDAIRKFYNFPDVAEITIGPNGGENFRPTPAVALVPSFFEKEVNQLELRNLLAKATVPGEKISAIRSLRTLGGYGLKEAKDAIENWEDFYNLMLRINRWPTPNGYVRDGNLSSVTQWK